MNFVRISLSVLALVLMLGGCASGRRTVTDGSLVVHSITINYSNSHLVTGSFGALLIDAGMAEDAPVLAGKVRELGVDPASLRALIVTHGHADHAGGARYFQERFKVPVVAGAGDDAMLLHGANDRLCPTDFIARRMLAEAQGARYPSTRADRLVRGRISLASVTGVEGLDGVIVPVPGHTPGSLVIVVGDMAFVGDLFRGGVLGMGAAEHFFMCDPASNRRDIDDFLAGDGRAARVFFTGHFGPVQRSAVQSMVNDSKSRSERD